MGQRCSADRPTGTVPPHARTYHRWGTAHWRLSGLSAQEGPAEEPSALKCVTLLQVGTCPCGHCVRHKAAAACERLLNPLMQTHCDLYTCNLPCAGRTAVAGAARVRCQQSMGAPVRQHHCRHSTAHSEEWNACRFRRNRTRASRVLCGARAVRRQQRCTWCRCSRQAQCAPPSKARSSAHST
jgi:hypothetical protein